MSSTDAIGQRLPRDKASGEEAAQIYSFTSQVEREFKGKRVKVVFITDHFTEGELTESWSDCLTIRRNDRLAIINVAAVR
ncbi:MAG: hypothetical protein V3S51_03305 [Dehalococcoidia bacterium]